MISLRTPTGRLLLVVGDQLVLIGPAHEHAIPLASIDEIVVSSDSISVRGAHHLPADIATLQVPPHALADAAAFRDAVHRAARDGAGVAADPADPPVEDRLTLSRPAARRPNYGPPTRERPDIKAAMHWFRQIDVDDRDKAVIAAIGDDELVLGAFEVWQNSEWNWHPLVVTDRRLIRAVATPAIEVHEMQLSAVIHVARIKTDDGQVNVKLKHRAVHYTLWVRNEHWYLRFEHAMWWARSRSHLSRAPSPEPLRGTAELERFDAWQQLRSQIDSDLISESEAGSKIAKIFGVPGIDQPE